MPTKVPSASTYRAKIADEFVSPVAVAKYMSPRLSTLTLWQVADELTVETTTITALIGRFRQMAAAQRACRVENATGEVVGIELAADAETTVGGLSILADYADPRLR